MRLQLIAVLLLCLPSTMGLADDEWRISGDTLVYTDTDNVLVVSPQAAVHYALDDDGGEVSARVVVDAVSAASVDIVSQATNRFSEVREQADLAVAKSIDGWLPSLSYRGSFEPDYVSHGGHVGLQRRLGTADSTLAVGYGLTRDTVGMASTPPEVFSELLMTHSADAAFTQVLDPRTLVRLVYTLTIQTGYMEKPYRLVPLFEQAGRDAASADGMKLNLHTFDSYRLDSRPPEQVPDRRVRNAIGGRALRFIDAIDAAARVDYQFYFDSWGVLAHTVEPGLRRALGDSVRLDVFARIYHQSAASFWQRAYVVSSPDAVPTFRTLDRGLTSFNMFTGGVRAEYSFWSMSTYVDASVMHSIFDDYLFLHSRTALVSQVGLRWNP